ncbi:MAG: hypothetical protein FWG91_08645 [Lachnospiraceae bacterium]|nr:hypothetical protein [Lachnospiraceae bacterium]
MADRLLIIRLSKVLSPKDILSEIKNAESNKIYSNIVMGFNTAVNVANAISYCIEKNKRGILHLTSIDFMATNAFTKLLISNYGKTGTYMAEKLSLEGYLNLLGAKDQSLVSMNEDNVFRLCLSSIDSDIVDKFGLTCEEVVKRLCRKGDS